MKSNSVVRQSIDNTITADSKTVMFTQESFGASKVKSKSTKKKFDLGRLDLNGF